MKRAVWLFVVLFSCVATFAEAQSPEKKIFAHYMGCFPVGYGAVDFHRGEMAEKMRHDSADALSAAGGRFVNWPLTPQSGVLTPEQSAELEIRRALRAGIDGFAIDAWAGGENAKNVFRNLIYAAERMHAPFQITVCLDASCHPESGEPGDRVEAYSDSIRWILDNFGSSPNLARRNGKVLIFGYHSRAVRMTAAMRDEPEGPEKWQKTVDAYRQIEENVGQDLYFHFCFDAFFHGVPRERIPENAPREAVRFLARHFDAIGGFLGDTWWSDPEIRAAIRAGGAEWSVPMLFQYVNKSYLYITGNGLDILRERWNAALETDSTLLQFVTWNDYGEDTVLAPGYSTGFTISCVNRYYADLWKTGRTLPDTEQIHLIYRRSPWGAASYPFPKDGMGGTEITPPGKLEILTLLREPGHVVIPEYDLSYDAPAGLFFRQVPLRVGPISAKLTRNENEILTVRAPEPVSDRPFRRDASMVCFSSNFDDEWRADFPDVNPLHYSEYGDVDGDGLPNWFEMYWFGKFPDMATAGCAEPNADPDGDGVTNLREFQNRTNPVVAEKPYEKSVTWTLDAIHERGVSFNPDCDSHGTPVWFYLYKIGPRLETPHDGDYTPCPYLGQNVSYAGQMAHLSPSRDETFPNVHGWISRFHEADGSWTLIFKPRVNSVLILGWRSPIAGTVFVSADILPVQGQDGITFEIAHGNQTIFEKTYEVGSSDTLRDIPVSVRPGEFLYFITDEKPGYDASDLRIKNLRIVWKR